MNENWKAMVEKIRARASGLRTAADGCSNDDVSQIDRFALLARADEAKRIAAWVEDAIGDAEKKKAAR